MPGNPNANKNEMIEDFVFVLFSFFSAPGSEANDLEPPVRCLIMVNENRMQTANIAFSNFTRPILNKFVLLENE